MATEKRLIDANALVEEINEQRRASKTSYPRRSYVVGDVLTSIYNAPIVDAVEVVHGRWRIIDFKGNVECSECGYTMDLEYKYCPNCGAKMDGDGNA